MAVQHSDRGSRNPGGHVLCLRNGRHEMVLLRREEQRRRANVTQPLPDVVTA